MTNFGEEGRREDLKLKVTLVKSLIGRVPKHRRTVRALGLRKMHQVVVHDDNSVIRGMIKEVEYLLEVERVSVEGSVPSPLAGEGQGEGGENDDDR